MVFGTYIHGIFDNDSFRRHILDLLRERKGWEPLEASEILTVYQQREKDFNKLAEVVRGSLDMDKVYEIMGLNDESGHQEQGAV